MYNMQIIHSITNRNTYDKGLTFKGYEFYLIMEKTNSSK